MHPLPCRSMYNKRQKQKGNMDLKGKHSDLSFLRSVSSPFFFLL